MRFSAPLSNASLLAWTVALLQAVAIAAAEIHIESIQAYIPKGDPAHVMVNVSLAKWPSEDLRDVGRWQVQVAVTELDVTSWRAAFPVTVAEVSQMDRIVVLSVTNPGQCGDCRFRVRFDGQEWVETSKSAKKQLPFYVPAKKKDDADIYFNGAVTTSKEKKANYSVDAVLGASADAGAWGVFGVRSTFVVDKQPDLDPNSITIAAAYRKVIAASRQRGLILHSDLFRGEFDKHDAVRNGVSTLLATVVLGRAYVDEHTYIGIDPVAGFEFGRNFRRFDESQDERIGRFLAGADFFYGTFRHGKPDLFTIDGQYRLRMLSTAEPFTAAGTTAPVFDHSRRHYLSIDAGVALTEYLGITVGLRDGSLPPLYQAVSRKLTVGLALKVRQRLRTTP